ncbi:TPA_asm: movement protein [Bacopa monnieri virus 3]|nr:TPA_asm: movement protein [Bacopa monnieri virus 3]
MNELNTKNIDIYEENINIESNNQRIIFDNTIHNKIKNEDFTLDRRKFFKQPMLMKLKKQKHEIVVVSKREKAIDIKDTTGKVCLPLLDKQMIKYEIDALKQQDICYRYVELIATEVIIKACFTEGINTPIELMLVDERIIEPIEKSIIAELIGNLVYQKVRFIINPNYSVSLTDKYIEKSYVLYFKLTGIKMPEGAKVISIKCKNAYIISTNHHIKTKHKLQPLTIDNMFQEILKPVLGRKELTYEEPNDTKDLELAIERTRSIRIDNQVERNIIYRQYYINSIINNKEVKTLIDSGAAINLLGNNLAKNKGKSTLKYTGIEGSEINSLGNTNEIIIITTQQILVNFELYDKNECILGNIFLDQVKPWKIEDEYFEFTHKGIKFKTKRML